MMRIRPPLRPRLVPTNAVLLDLARQAQHRPVAQREECEGANPETCRGDENRHGPIRTEGGRNARAPAMTQKMRTSAVSPALPI
jgi:hypothetical protein